VKDASKIFVYPTKALIAFVLYLQIGGVNASSSSEFPKTIWEYEYGSTNRLARVHTVSLSINGSEIAVAGLSSDPGGTGKNPELFLLRVNQSGKVISRLDLGEKVYGKEIPKIMNPFGRAICCSVFLPDNKLVVVISGRGNTSKLIVVSPNGQMDSVVDLKSTPAGATYFDVRVSKSQLTVFGQDSENLYVETFRLDNWKNTSKALPKNKIVKYSDTGARSSGEIAVVGTVVALVAGEIKYLGSELVLLKSDYKKIYKKVVGNSKSGSVEYLSNGRLLLVHDTGDDYEQNIQIIQYRNDFKILHKSNVRKQRSFGRNETLIAVSENDQILLAGRSQAHRMWITKMHSSGKVIWQAEEAASHKSRGVYDIFAYKDTAYVVFPVYNETSDKRIAYRFGIRKFIHSEKTK